MKTIYAIFFVFIMIGTSSITKAQVYYVSTYAGSVSGAATNSNISDIKFKNPERLTYDKDSNIIVVDRANHVIRKIILVGMVSKVAGNGISGTIHNKTVTCKVNFIQANLLKDFLFIHI
ncbi:MAG TPA: hypothetical protein VL125_03710 [Pelobium sp.]|nr:hypothetical protein [Pelobium sp.]